MLHIHRFLDMAVISKSHVNDVSRQLVQRGQSLPFNLIRGVLGGFH